jgi:multiple sugar transport system permease protein
MLERDARNWRLTAIAAAITLAYLFPVYWMFVSGFKGSAEIFARPPTLFPRAPSLDAMRHVLERENVGRALWNSFAISGAAMAIALAIGAPAAYALARVRARWVDMALMAILVVQVLPPALLATPMFVILKQVGLINTQLGAIVANSTRLLPFVIVILRPAFLLIPKELEEAGRVDGCTRVTAFWRIVLPIARVNVVVAAALAFIMAYGDLAYGLALMSDQAIQPATVALYGFVGAEYADWQNVMAFAGVFVLPVIVIFLLLQRQIVRGLTAGAVK